MRFTASATGGTPTSTVTFDVKDRSFSEPIYTPYGQRVRYTYLTPCTSVPGIASPNLQSPADGAVTTFTSATVPSTASVNFSWSNVGDPQRRYILATTSQSTISAQYPTLSSTRTLTWTYDTVTVSATGTPNTSKALARNQVYTWKVRAVNCSQSAPCSATRSFTIR